MQGRTATVIGGTGLIGNELIRQMVNDPWFTTIRVLVRRLVQFSDPKIEMRLINFDDPEAFKIAIDGSDAVFCAVGTTTKKVKGDKATYHKVDVDIPVHAARFCEETGCPNFLVISSVGANTESNNFYLKLKGEMENEVKKMKIRSISIFRPSMLLGHRKEFRLGENMGKILMKPFSFLIPSKYKPVQASTVAAAMIASAKKMERGVHTFYYKEITALATADLRQAE